MERRRNVLETISKWQATLESDAPLSEISPIIKFVETFSGCPRPPAVAGCVFPQLDKKKKRERASSLFSTPPAKRKAISKTSPSTTAIQELIDECANCDITEPCWMYLVTLNHHDVLQSLSNRHLVNQQSFIERFELARTIWTCFHCKDLGDIDKNLSGYALCDTCQNWFHCQCVGQEEEAVREGESNWCPNCN